MKNRQSIWHRVTQLLYSVFIGQLIWLMGLVLGLGIFSLIPTTITTFQFINEVKGNVEISRMKELKFWWSNFRDNLKRTWKYSIIYSLLGFILISNLYFLSYQASILSMLVYFITFLLIFILIFIGVWFAYLMALYPEVGDREILQNAVAYPMAHILEMIIILVFTIGLLLVFQEVSLGLLAVMGIGSSFVLIYYGLSWLVSGRSLKQTFKQWRRQDSYD